VGVSNELGPGDRPSTFLVGEPDSSGTTVTISEASKRSGVSISTLRRRLAKGQIPGAYKAPGKDGEEWRIPVASIPEPSDNPRDSSTDDLRRELDDALRRAETAEKDLASERRTREELSKAVDGLREAIALLDRALPPASPNLVESVVDAVTTPTIVGGGEGASTIEQALAKGPRSWFRKRALKPTP